MDLVTASKVIADQVATETTFPKGSPEFWRIHFGAAQGFRLAVPLIADAEADFIANWLSNAAAVILTSGMADGKISLERLELGVTVIEFVAETIRTKEYRNGC